jgi:hypothetical protein
MRISCQRRPGIPPFVKKAAGKRVPRGLGVQKLWPGGQNLPAKLTISPSAFFPNRSARAFPSQTSRKNAVLERSAIPALGDFPFVCSLCPEFYLMENCRPWPSGHATANG